MQWQFASPLLITVRWLPRIYFAGDLSSSHSGCQIWVYEEEEEEGEWEGLVGVLGLFKTLVDRKMHPAALEGMIFPSSRIECHRS